MPTGNKLVAQNDPQDTSATGATTNRSGIWAKKDVSLWVGDDVDAPSNTAIVAGGTIYIHGDANRAGSVRRRDEPRPARDA